MPCTDLPAVFRYRSGGKTPANTSRREEGRGCAYVWHKHAHKVSWRHVSDRGLGGIDGLENNIKQNWNIKNMLYPGG